MAKRKSKPLLHFQMEKRGKSLCGIGAGRATTKIAHVTCPTCRERALQPGDGLKPAMEPINWPNFNRPSVEEVDQVLGSLPRCEVAHSRDYHEPTLFDPSPLVPLYSTRDIYEYFITSLGTPQKPGRLRELRGRQDWPIDSVCGQECVKAIDAAVTLLQCMRAAYGVHNHRAESIREATLHICEVVCFG